MCLPLDGGGEEMVQGLKRKITKDVGACVSFEYWCT